MSEALRWGVPAPLSKSHLAYCGLNAALTTGHCEDIPHVVMEEDIFRDMRIPKGSLVRT